MVGELLASGRYYSLASMMLQQLNHKSHQLRSHTPNRTNEIAAHNSHVTTRALLLRRDVVIEMLGSGYTGKRARMDKENEIWQHPRVRHPSRSCHYRCC